MATLEAFRAVLDDKRTPEIIRNHIIKLLQGFSEVSQTYASIELSA
jgi:hypothetical protein